MELFTGDGYNDLVQVHAGGLVDYPAAAYADAHRVMRARASAAGIEFEAVYGAPAFADKNRHVDRLQAEIEAHKVQQASTTPSDRLKAARRIADQLLVEKRSEATTRDLTYEQLIGITSWQDIASEVNAGTFDLTADVDAWMRLCPSYRTRATYEIGTQLALCRTNGPAACFVGLQVPLVCYVVRVRVRLLLALLAGWQVALRSCNSG